MKRRKPPTLGEQERWAAEFRRKHGRSEPVVGASKDAASEWRRKQAFVAARQRQLEVTAAAIASPPDIRPDPEHPPDGYIVQEAGRVYRFRSTPEFAAWLMVRMHERQAALVLSRGELKSSKDGSVSGKEGAKKRDATCKKDALNRVIELCNARGERDLLYSYAAEWIRAGIAPRSTVYSRIKAHLSKRK